MFAGRSVAVFLFALTVFLVTVAPGMSAVTYNGIVTADLNDFSGYCYLEDSDRGFGIKFVYSGDPVVHRGDHVTVIGNQVMDTNNESYINATTVTIISPDNPLPGPVAMVAKSLGGANTGTRIGVNTPAGVGVCNKGLLVRCWGKVTVLNSGQRWFYLDDGSGLNDGTGHGLGVKVSWATKVVSESNPQIIPPAVDSYVLVTGISSSETPSGANVIRVLRPRRQEDITILSSSDNTPPVIAITMPEKSSVTKPAIPVSVTIAGTASDESEVASVEVGFTAVGSATPPSSWSPASYDMGTDVWRFAWATPTAQRIWARATDYVGNAGTTYHDLTAISTGASVIYVDSARPDDLGDGLSWETAKKKVASGLTAASAGQEVWVAKGTYVERITLKLAVKLLGGFNAGDWYGEARDWNANVTILDGSGGGSVVTAPATAIETTVIDGFTIRNGRSANGAGIRCDSSSPTISNNRITGNNGTQFGAGIRCAATAAPIIRDNIISGNKVRNPSSMSYGGGIYISGSSPTIENNVIESNISEYGGSYAYGGAIYCSAGSPKISGNLIRGNTATSAGGAIFIQDGSTAPIITNNTIVGNTAGYGGGFYSRLTATAKLSNNIIAFNSSGIHKLSSSGVLTLRNNCVYGSTGDNYKDQAPGEGDISYDPLFVDSVNGNYHLQTGSPCIDTGWDEAEAIPATDMDGATRSVDIPAVGTGIIDIGADEVQG